jgi:hypothetical protein
MTLSTDTLALYAYTMLAAAAIALFWIWYES